MSVERIIMRSCTLKTTSSQQMVYSQNSLPSCLRIGAAPTAATNSPTVNGAPRLRSVQGLPQLPKLDPLYLSFDEQPSQAQSTAQEANYFSENNLAESPVCIQDLSTFDGHLHDERLSSEDVSNIDGHLSQERRSCEDATNFDGHMHTPRILPREMEESDSFTEQESDNNAWTRVDNGIGPHGFPPPPESEVMKYSRKPLPNPPSPTQKNREKAVERVVQSVPASRPTLHLHAERPKSYAASLHAAVADNGLEEVLFATNQTTPAPMTWYGRHKRRRTWDQKFREYRTSTGMNR